MRYPNRWEIGEWTFFQVEEHGFDHVNGAPLYGFGDGSTRKTGALAGQPAFGELYETLEHAMVAAVAEKYTGRRGAGGTGVDTAAGWFMRMIGADRPTLGELIDAAGPDHMMTGIAEDAGAGTGRQVVQMALEALDRAGHTVYRRELD